MSDSEATVVFVIVMSVLILLTILRSRRKTTKETPTRAPNAPATAPAPGEPWKHYDIYTLPPPKVIPSDVELGIVRPQPDAFVAKPCEHRLVLRRFRYHVYGVDIRVPHVTRCPDCMQTLLETFFEQCAECGLGIRSGGKVAISWIGAPHPYTHLECAESPMLMCGVWGYGQLLTLNMVSQEFNPGVATVLEDSEIDLAREAKPPEPTTDDESEETEETNPSGPAKPGVN